MTQCKILATTIILSAFIATPSFAQRMIEEPGMLAFIPMGTSASGRHGLPLTPRLLRLSAATATGPHVVRKPRPAVARRYNLLIRPTSI